MMRAGRSGVNDEPVAIGRPKLADVKVIGPIS
jgi:hypothetical protein